MTVTERDLVSRLLKQSILTLCRETVSFKDHLALDGIICLTVDDQSQHVVNIHELFQKRTTPKSAISTLINGHDRDKSDVTICHTFQCPEVIEYSDDESVHTITCGGVNDDSVNDATDNRNHIIKTENATADIKEEIDEMAIKPGNSFSPLAAVKSSLQKLSVSKSKNILCKKCNAVIDDAPSFENHNMLSHGHFTCLVCLATFTSRNNMKRHIRLHTGIKPYVCHKCPESFARNDDFKRHLLRHTFEKPFRCAVCKTGYSDRSCVKGHMLKEHQSRIFHICPQCGESYVDSLKFQQHKKTHLEFQDYRCTLCLFTGSNALMYNKHMLSHGPPKKYTCTHCDIGFTDPFPYTSHLKKHKGDELVQSFECCFCDLKLQTYEQFQRHEHSHIHAKQHTCDVCQKHFRYPSNLREHMLSHMRKPDSSCQSMRGTDVVINIDDENLTRNETPQKIRCEMTASAEKTSTAIVEENNNTVDMIKDTDKSDMDTDANRCNESNEYWCTECNQGFGSEDHLQEHIFNTHEQDDDEVDMLEGSTENATGDDFEKNLDQTNENSRDTLKDADDISERGTSQLSSDSPYETSTKVKTESCSIYDENTQHDVFVSPKAKRSKIFDEETVVDDNDDYQRESERTVQDMTRKMLPLNMTSAEVTIVNDAMRQVHAIQSRFGIKPSLYTDYRKLSNKSSPYGAKISNTVRDSVNNVRDSVTATSYKESNGGQSSMTMYGNRNWHIPEMKDTPPSVGHLKIPHKPVSVTLEGMKMKITRKPSSDSIERTPNFDKINESHSPVSVESQNGSSIRDNDLNVSNDSNSLSPNPHYSKSSVLGMDTEFSSTPNRGSPTTLNLKIRNPGFEKVVTPEILFKTKAPFTCEVCEETFLEFESFDQHGVTIHRRYICSYCGKAFTSRPNRERHIRYHTGIKPYVCELCTASFFRGDDLKYHRTTKHADVRPFSCGACNSAFSLPKELEKHLRVYPDHRA